MKFFGPNVAVRVLLENLLQHKNIVNLLNEYLSYFLICLVIVSDENFSKIALRAQINSFTQLKFKNAIMNPN